MHPSVALSRSPSLTVKGPASDMTSPAAQPAPADPTETDSAFVGLAEGVPPAAPAPSVEDALAELYPLDPTWEYDRIDFRGDKLAVRPPTRQALAGFSLASSKYVPADVKNDMTGLFLSEHLGPDTYNHVMARLFRAKDPDYTPDTIGELLREMVLITVNAEKSAQETAE